MEWQEKDELREAVTGFTISTALISKLETLPRVVSNRLMTLCIPLANNAHLLIASTYAQTMTYADDEKEAFYELLNSTIHTTLKNDKLLLLGGFNVHVGINTTAWPSVLGPHGMGKENSNGFLLLILCSEEELTITNMLFEQPKIHKATWMHSGSKHFIITRHSDISIILITRAMRGADSRQTALCSIVKHLSGLQASIENRPEVKEEPQCEQSEQLAGFTRSE